MTLNPVCENVETAQGVPLTVTGVAQVKIMKDQALLKIASEQFLGKKEHEIKSTVLQTLEGHLRAILGTLTVEEVYKDRDQFASLVREVAAPDVGRMGIEILSFTIKDVYDNVDYLASLGKTQTAAVKRDAEIGVAQANRDAGIREAECEKSAMDIKYSTDTKIEDNSRGFKLREERHGHQVQHRHQDRGQQQGVQVAEGKLRQRGQHRDCRGAVGLRAAGGQDPAAHQKRRDSNSGCGAAEADRDRGAGDQEEGEGTVCHRTAARRGRGLQDPDCGRGEPDQDGGGRPGRGRED